MKSGKRNSRSPDRSTCPIYAAGLGDDWPTYRFWTLGMGVREASSLTNSGASEDEADRDSKTLQKLCGRTVTLLLRAAGGGLEASRTLPDAPLRRSVLSLFGPDFRAHPECHL